jgi:hypothetical protein
MSQRFKNGENRVQDPDETSPGIVITNLPGNLSDREDHPRISAFIWGGKVRPVPTLPYGRWKGAA